MMIKLLPSAFLCCTLFSFVSSNALQNAKDIANNFASHLRYSTRGELNDIIAPGAKFYDGSRGWLKKKDFITRVASGHYSDLEFSTYNPSVNWDLDMSTFQITFMDGSRSSFSLELGYAQNLLQIKSGQF